jgi:ubiquinone/menaquinone biosynthesis C-methylase UbiE
LNQDSAINERDAEAAFSKQAPVFDELYGPDMIIQYKRKRVRQHVLEFLPACSQILELNAGTGEDAVYFAGKGHKVHATDISGAMLDILSDKVIAGGLEQQVTTEICSFTNLENLRQQGPFELIFSNFAGLNCTRDLSRVLDSFSFLVKPGGWVTLVILPKFCLWEFLLLFKGKFRTAFRRFAGKKGAKARIGDEYFRCWYYNPSFIRKHLKESFSITAVEGLCTLVPPSYFENFAGKHPHLYRFFQKKEDRLKTKWPWKVIGDYYIITLKRKE